MMMNRKNLPGVANPMRRPLPVVLDPVGRVAVAMPNTGTPRNPLVVGGVTPRPIVRFGNKKMKIGFV